MVRSTGLTACGRQGRAWVIDLNQAEFPALTSSFVDSKSKGPNHRLVGVVGVPLEFGEMAVRGCEDDRQALGIVGA